MAALDKFSSSLESDLAWRKKETSNLLLLVSEDNHEIIIKSAILMIYSHWEGYVKNACKAYLDYIARKSLPINDLTDNYKAIVLKGIIKQMEASKESLTLSGEILLLKALNSEENKKFSLGKNFKNNEQDKSIVNTKDNLNYKVFKSILNVVGLGERNCIDSKEIFLDEKLLKNRNKIAHGNKISPGADDFDLDLPGVRQVKDFVFTVMDSLMEDLISYAENEFFFDCNTDDSASYNIQSNSKLDKSLITIFKT